MVRTNQDQIERARDLQDRLDDAFPGGIAGTIIQPGVEAFVVLSPRLCVADFVDERPLLWGVLLNIQNKDVYIEAVRTAWPRPDKFVVLASSPIGRHWEFERPADEAIASELKAWRRDQFSEIPRWSA